MSAVLWSIRKPHTDNIKSRYKRDEIRTRIPKDLTPDTINFIYESKANGGCGKVIGQFRVIDKTYIYYWIDESGGEHLANTAFIQPCLTDRELVDYLKNGRKPDKLGHWVGWGLRIADLQIFDEPMGLWEFRHISKGHKKLDGKWSYVNSTLTRPPQSWQYVEVEL